MNHQNNAPRQKLKAQSGLVTALLVAAIAVIAVFPLFLNFGDRTAEEEFGGTDAKAGEVVLETDPDYEPWFEPLVGELPSEVESGLFALQAALGAGVLGYVIGFYRGRSRGGHDSEGSTPNTSDTDASKLRRS